MARDIVYQLGQHVAKLPRNRRRLIQPQAQSTQEKSSTKKVRIATRGLNQMCGSSKMNSCVCCILGTKGSSGRWKRQVMATSEERVIHTKNMNEVTPLSWVAKWTTLSIWISRPAQARGSPHPKFLKLLQVNLDQRLCAMATTR
jgi:hypothetical protein